MGPWKFFLEASIITVDLMLQEEEAKARALDKQKALLKTLEEKGVQILGNRVKIGIQKGVCTAKGTLAVVEKAGQQVPVQIPQEPAERNADVDE